MSTPRRFTELDPAEGAALALGVSVADLGDEAGVDASLARAWAELPAAGRAVLSALAGLGGCAAPALLVTEAAEELGGVEAAEDATRAVQRAVEDLWERQLVARDRATREIFAVAPIARGLARLLERELFESLPRIAPAQPAVDEHVLACAASIVAHEPLRLTREGRPHARGLVLLGEKLAPLLGPGSVDESCADVVEALLAAGMLREDEGSLQLDRVAARAWARLDPLARVDAVLRSERSSHEALLLLRLLHVLAVDRTLPVALSRRTLRRLAARRERGEPGATADASADRLEDAARRHDRAVRVLVQSGLAVRAADGGVALTAAGRQYPRLAVHHAPRSFHVGSDLTILVPRGLAPALHLEVGAVARLERADVAARYRLDRQLVLEALDRGASKAGLLAFLERHAEPALPRVVRDDVLAWCERFGEVSSHEGIAVACEVATRLREFQAVVEHSSLAVTLVAPGVAVVAPRDHAALCDELRQAGFMARRSVAAPARARAGVEGAGAVAEPLFDPEASVHQREEELAAQPSWRDEPLAARERRATPPPRGLVSRLKDKYRREFGGAHVTALDLLDLDELLDMEERGRVRQYLSSLAATRAPGVPDVDLADYAQDEVVPITPAKARQVLGLAVAAGVTCQVAYSVRTGQRARLVIEPLAVTEEGGAPYLRARALANGQERLIAVDRIHGLRVLRPART